MTTTDTRSGFRLPWSSERSHDTDLPEGPVDGVDPTEGSDESGAMGGGDDAPEIDVRTGPGFTSHNPGRAAPAASPPSPPEESAAMIDTVGARTLAPASVPRKPSKLMTDLIAAMRSTAEAAREQALAQVEADVRQAVDAIRAQSTAGVAAIRLRSEEDIAAIRERSKAEIIRVREETERRIADRKSLLEADIADHAAAIERRVEEARDAVAGYQADMTAFFERLLQESDPARLATIAETMPEPPSIEAGPEPSGLDVVPPVVDVLTAPVSDVLTPVAAAITDDASSPADVAGEVGNHLERVDERDGTMGRVALMAALEAEDAAMAEAEAETAAAAEDEAADTAGMDADRPEPEPSFVERLASMLPAPDDDAGGAPRTTRLNVTGLVSVASIAAFKRHLARSGGVEAVSVASGPGGEFLFTVTHRADVSLGDVVPAMPGFAARVINAGDGVVNVMAHDPETEG